MPMVTLRDLYIAELEDLYDAEQQILQELPAMAAQATSSDLRKAFDDHLEQTRVQTQRLELLFRQLDIRTGGHPCEGVRGLIEEGRRRIADAERGELLDAALIGIAQRIEHYEIAAYGCARTYARTLGDGNAETLLQQTLDEEGHADHVLSRIAERGINQAAGEDTLGATRDVRERARLRYIAASDLSEFEYRDYRLLTRANEDLGTLDGFVVESRSGRPIYLVIDSGGWFVGRRYLVPVGQIDVDASARVLRTALDRQAIHRYPEFNGAAFLAMDDDEARRYEHRLLSIIAPERGIAGRWTRPNYDELPQYRQPTWLMTGVWMTEASGFAAVPPRSESDLRDERERARREEKDQRPRTRESHPENELLIARGESDEPIEH
jgi:ferritin-like metal-binding protein YciE